MSLPPWERGDVQGEVVDPDAPPLCDECRKREAAHIGVSHRYDDTAYWTVGNFCAECYVQSVVDELSLTIFGEAAKVVAERYGQSANCR